MKVRVIFVVLSLLILGGIVAIYFVWPTVLWSLIVIGPIILVGFYDMFQKKHAIKRNFPVIGNFRYMLEKIRPEIMQYFAAIRKTQSEPIQSNAQELFLRRATMVPISAIIPNMPAIKIMRSC